MCTTTATPKSVKYRCRYCGNTECKQLQEIEKLYKYFIVFRTHREIMTVVKNGVVSAIFAFHNYSGYIVRQRWCTRCVYLLLLCRFWDQRFERFFFIPLCTVRNYYVTSSRNRDSRQRNYSYHGKRPFE